MKQPMDHQRKQSHRPARKPGRFDSSTRRDYNLRLVADRANAGRITVAQYLRSIGASGEFADRYAGAFGKVAKRIHVERYGADAPCDGLAAARGRLFRVRTYAGERLTVLSEAAQQYPRTTQFAV